MRQFGSGFGVEMWVVCRYFEGGGPWLGGRVDIRESLSGGGFVPVFYGGVVLFSGIGDIGRLWWVHDYVMDSF